MLKHRRARPAQRSSPVAVVVDSFCVACGSRNVVRFTRPSSARTMLQCRCCAVVSPDFNQPRVPSGLQANFEPLLHSTTQVMANEVLDAFAQEHTKRKLQKLLAQAHGDVALICQTYVPYVVDVVAATVANYGYAVSLAGVQECIRTIQLHARDDEQLVHALVRMRQLLTPTGAWIQEDADADIDEQLKEKNEAEERRRQQAEAVRMERLAEENARKARLHAKKVALGLDPTVPRLPLLVDAPPPAVVAHQNARVQLRVNAQYVQKFQWFFNGRALSDGDGIAGSQRSTLVINRLTRRVVGDYYCVCENEEGIASSSATQVQTVSLGSRRLATRKLKALPSGTPSLVACGRRGIVASCVGGSLQFFDARTLVPAKTLPPINVNHATSVAWLGEIKLLVVASSTNGNCGVVFYSLDDSPSRAPPPANATAAGPGGRLPPPPPGRQSGQPQGNLPAGSPSASAPSASTPGVINRLLGAYKVPHVHAIESIQFANQGRLVIITDLRHCILVYERSPEFECKHIMTYGTDTHIRHIGTAPTVAVSAPAFTVCFRDRPYIEIFDTNQLNSHAARRLKFKFPVYLVAFDHRGLTLAVAEAGYMKSWISIVDVASHSLPSSCPRFVAHVGNVSALQWTKQSALLLTSGYDGYVKLWDLEIATCVFRIHLDFRGLHSLLLLDFEDPSAGNDGDHIPWLAMGFTDCRLHARQLLQLRAFEATRRAEFERLMANVQRIWKGKQTRDLIAKHIKAPSRLPAARALQPAV